MDETNTFIVNLFSKSSGPFLYIYLYLRKLVAFLNVHTREIQYLSLMYSMYANASNNARPYTHIRLYVVWRVHPPIREMTATHSGVKTSISLTTCLTPLSLGMSNCDMLVWFLMQKHHTLL